MTVPVYLFTGFLESGKTCLIQETLADPGFTENEKTLIICCEEGSEEYAPEDLKKWKADIFYVENFKDLTYELMIELNKKYKPDRVMIEFNGTWNVTEFLDVEMPIGWLMVQIISSVDASTFQIYAQNMKQMIFNQIVHSELIIFNRCDENTNKRFIRNNLKAINKNAQIIYESLDGNVTDKLGEEDLPFDVNASELVISDDDFGLFYMDALEHPEKYKNKLVTIKGIAVSAVQGDKNAVILGRYAMVCCADDTSLCGILVRDIDRSQFKEKAWISVTGNMNVYFDQQYNQKFIVIQAYSFKEEEPLKDPFVYFS